MRVQLTLTSSAATSTTNPTNSAGNNPARITSTVTPVRRRSAQKARAERKLGPASRNSSQMRHGRTLHLVDIENLIGDSEATVHTIRTVWETYKVVAGIHEGDTVFIGCADNMGRNALLAIRDNVRFIWRNGEHGGENALMDMADPSWAARRFEWVVIASGDGGFIPWVHEAQARGIKTWLVSGNAQVSVELRGICQLHSRIKLRNVMRWQIPSAAAPSPHLLAGQRQYLRISPKVRRAMEAEQEEMRGREPHALQLAR